MRFGSRLRIAAVCSDPSQKSLLLYDSCRSFFSASLTALTSPSEVRRAAAGRSSLPAPGIGQRRHILRRTPELDRRRAIARFRQVVTVADADRVGAAERFPQDVAQLRFEDVRGRAQPMRLRARPRLASAKKLMTVWLRGSRPLVTVSRTTSFGNCIFSAPAWESAVPSRRQAAKGKARQQRRDVVHLERADEEEREVGGVRKTILVELHHRFRIELRGCRPL